MKSKFVRIHEALAQLVSRASVLSGVKEQQIFSDALILYFTPSAVGAAAQRDVILQRLAEAETDQGRNPEGSCGPKPSRNPPRQRETVRKQVLAQARDAETRLQHEPLKK
ncbi:MAG: hypothetical protein HZA90_05605 [Verrucomicrobia bacterium]|nr:hypothetical protein [Verrucomicrobiota bacterium]